MDVDLNSDLGEGAGHDAEIIPLITSANVCCGFHAGSTTEIINTLRLAKEHGVVVGAHPGYPDREHFGRRELPFGQAQLFVECSAQIGVLRSYATAMDVTVRYLKPHGGLYHQANRESSYAEPLVELARNENLILMGLPDSQMQIKSRDRCGFVAEGFADRRYRPDGSLVPRDQPDAFIDDPAQAVAQVEWLLRERGVRTICVHGDNPQAVAFVRALREALLQKGHVLRPFA